MTVDRTLPGSFRDPTGSVVERNGEILRHLYTGAQTDYDHLLESGLYQKLVDARLMVAHTELPADTKGVYKVLKPDYIPFISYPYEWSFSQLQDAALCTLKILNLALEHDMILKDASAYNIQFLHGAPILIDTLSFKKYQADEPWQAYGQFCRHFLAPLALMAYCDLRLNRLLQLHLDGIPLDLASGMLPFKACCNFSLLHHLVVHAQMQNIGNKTSPSLGQTKNDGDSRLSPGGVSRMATLGLADSLKKSIAGLKLPGKSSHWSQYYQDNTYSDQDTEAKKNLVANYLNALKPKVVWDLGANTGVFSRIASGSGINTIAFDSDPLCVELNYLAARDKNDSHLLPLVLDLTNPSPSIGWDLTERNSLLQRAPADTVIALALIHHLSIANNVSLPAAAAFIAKICNSLIIEFVPKSDPQVKRLLSLREDIFPNYTQAEFESAFKTFFSIDSRSPIGSGERVLYMMRKLPSQS